jgi:hypothetical protein
MINQLATPGLGSLLGGRYVAGAGQLLLALAGCGLVFYWFWQTVIIQYYGLMFNQQSEGKSYAVWGEIGGTVMFVSWLWSLVTSISLYRQARAAQRFEFDNAPPPLREPPRLNRP